MRRNSRPDTTVNNKTRAKIRGGVGVLFILLGSIVIAKLVPTVVAKSGYRFETLSLLLPGVALGGAMIALGVVRVRAALAYLRAA